MKSRFLFMAIFSAAAVLAAVSAIAIYCLGLVAAEAAREMDRQVQVQEQLSDIGSTLKDAETGQRGYLLTGEDRYLEPYQAALSALQGQLDGLQKLAAAGDLPAAKVNELISISHDKLVELNQTIQVRQDQGLDAALAIVRTDRGKETMDQIRSSLGDMRAQVQDAFKLAEHRANRADLIRSFGFIAIALVNLVFLLWAYRKILSEVQQREVAVRELTESRGLLDSIINNSTTVIYVKDLAGHYLLVNRCFEKLFHVNLAQLAGKTDYDLFTRERADAFRAMDGQVIASDKVIEAEEQVPLDDGLHTYLSIKFPLYDAAGQPFAVGGMSTDITERKQVEDRVQAQLNRLGLLSQTTRAIAERLDLNSIFQIVVRSVEDHLPVDFACICLYREESHELTVATVGAKSHPLALELAMDEKAGIPIDENGLSRCIRGQLVYEPDITQANFPFPQRLARGGLRSIVLAPLLVENNVFGVLVAGRRAAQSFKSTDCEFLRQLSEHVALAAHQARLYTSLQEAYDDLRQTQQAVMQQERLRVLGQMASGIAHDINNAISPVALYTQSLLEREPNLSERARDYLQTIRDAIDDVAATVDRLREFYRQRETQLTLLPVDLNRVVKQVVDLTHARWSDMALQRGVVINLSTDLVPGLPAIQGIESEIRDALTNLVFNAVDAMPEGGALTLRTKTNRNGETIHVYVEVVDSGIGMNEETRRRCIEPFFTTKGERGTGLGLAMVYGMVQRHSAELELESKLGAGTTVRIGFIAPVTLPAGPASPTPSRVPLTPQRILVVDDDPLLLKSLRDALEQDGHSVVTADGGKNGIDTFRAALERKEPFSIVITDLGMPYVDGRQVASAINNLSPATPIIMLTGWGQRLIDDHDVPQQVRRVLSKPPKLVLLREAMAFCLQS